MKKLTKKEIRFIRETGWTPTLFQMDYSKNELKRTPFSTLIPKKAKLKYNKLAKNYKIKLDKLYNKICNIKDSDVIELEYEATYLLYTFFSPNELNSVSSEFILKWLQDFKYYFGYRKWDKKDVESNINEALEIYKGTRKFYKCNGHMWNKLKEK